MENYPQGLTREHGSHSTVDMRKVIEPSDALDQVIQQNQHLKEVNASSQEALRMKDEQIQTLQNQMKHLSQFNQILKNPIEKLQVELYDEPMLNTIRGHMITMFGTGGHLDAEGRWAQSVVNNRLQLLIRQLIFVGLTRWPQVQAQLDNIIKVQGLAK